jgi:hypothetical protein
MTKYTNKNTGVTIDVADDAALPAPEGEWESGSGTRKRRRADTGTVPVQNNNQ